MINTLRIYDELKSTLEDNAAKKITEVISLIYEDLQYTVTKAEFKELRDVVRDLVEAQKSTESRVEELAEAQKELTAAQKQTEQRVNELAEAQNRTEQRLGELAEAQKQTEERLQNLIEEHQQTREHLGGLSMSFGYTLENEAYKKLPELLKQDFNILIKDRLKRQYLTDNKGHKIEVNIVGKASKNGQDIVIIGESKSQLSKNDVDRFIRKKLNRLQGVFKEIFVILITHMISSPEVEEYVKEKGFVLYYSYDF